MIGRKKMWIGIAAPVLVIALTLGLGRNQAGSETSPTPSTPVDGARAFRDLEAVVGFGARPSGSENLRKTRDYIIAELRKAGLDPELDEFVALTPVGPIPMANIRAVRPGSRPETIAIGGHYDTKRFDFTFVGANDGGSSTALLLELARATAGLELDHALEFLFFDGEEALLEWTATDSLYGSRFDVQRRSTESTIRELKALILIDMIGDRDLRILEEAASTGWLKTILWNAARELGYAAHFGNESSAIEDDHVPYLDAGIAAVDLIDFDYPYWHTPGDTLDKTSPESLQIVGEVIYDALRDIDGYLVDERPAASRPR